MRPRTQRDQGKTKDLLLSRKDNPDVQVGRLKTDFEGPETSEREVTLDKSVSTVGSCLREEVEERNGRGLRTGYDGTWGGPKNKTKRKQNQRDPETTPSFPTTPYHD